MMCSNFDLVFPDQKTKYLWRRLLLFLSILTTLYKIENIALEEPKQCISKSRKSTTIGSIVGVASLRLEAFYFEYLASA